MLNYIYHRKLGMGYSPPSLWLRHPLFVYHITVLEHLSIFLFDYTIVPHGICKEAQVGYAGNNTKKYMIENYQLHSILKSNQDGESFSFKVVCKPLNMQLSVVCDSLIITCDLKDQTITATRRVLRG